MSTRLGQSLSARALDPPAKASFFPNISPAVMVLVQRQEGILLARSPHFQPSLYSALAGFVDLGESAEAAAHREVFEEVGLSIQDLTYFGSQSWPFPGSFMIAFTAHYAGGLLRLDPHEIEEACWFSIHHLPAIPPCSSIANTVPHGAFKEVSRQGLQSIINCFSTGFRRKLFTFSIYLRYNYTVYI